MLSNGIWACHAVANCCTTMPTPHIILEFVHNFFKSLVIILTVLAHFLLPMTQCQSQEVVKERGLLWLTVLVWGAEAASNDVFLLTFPEQHTASHSKRQGACKRCCQIGFHCKHACSRVNSFTQGPLARTEPWSSLPRVLPGPSMPSQSGIKLQVKSRKKQMAFKP